MKVEYKFMKDNEGETYLELIEKKRNSFLHRVMLFFHSHKWEYATSHDQTVRRCKCGVTHVNKHIVSQIYGGEHWYDHN